MRTPVIAAINGAAIGAALNVALLMDIVIVAEDAKLRLPFTRIGVVPDANATWLLPRLVGTQRALELFLTGRFFTGAEAVELGLALEGASRKTTCSTTALELAREIATYAAPGCGRSDEAARLPSPARDRPPESVRARDRRSSSGSVSSRTRWPASWR